MINELLKKYQNILHLNDWEISITEDDGISSAAETKLLFNDYKAIIRLKKDLSETEKEKSLIHELLHLIFRDAYDIFTEQVEDGFAKEYCARQHERAIEKTSKIIYSLRGENLD